MANLVPLKQAAAMLGMTAEQLTELRSNNEIFGYRDGSSWKFKMTELERVAADLNITLNSSADESVKPTAKRQSDELDLKDSKDGTKMKDDDSIRDDESSGEMISGDSSSDELIQEDSSTEIFSRPLGESAEALGDSGLELGSEDSLKLEDSSDSLKIHGSGSDILASEDNVIDEDDDEDLAFGSSSLSLAAESSKKLTGSDSADLLDDEEVGKKDSPSDTGKMIGEEELLIAEDDLFSDEMEIADSSGSFEDSAELSSDFEDSDLVMEDSDSSTEIVLEANESGINLSPNESGIAIDDSLELGGSDIDSLELPEDDDDIIMLDDPADPEQATMMQEDDFNLTPLEEAIDDESSGSQVIALEDSEIYTDESSATILAESSELGTQPAMLDDTMGFDTGQYGAGLAPAGVAGVGGAPAVLPEAPYSVYQVISLGLVAALLSLGAMIAYDLARNMWMAEDQVVNSGILKFFLDMVRMS